MGIKLMVAAVEVEATIVFESETLDIIEEASALIPCENL
jgi:hypothetical protein